MPDQPNSEHTEEKVQFVDKRRMAEDADVESAPNPEPSPDLEEAAKAAMEEQEALAEAMGVWGLAAYMIEILSAEAWQTLGLVANPRTGKIGKDLRQARVAIDSVAALIGVVDQQDSQLPEELRRDLRRVLNDLRLNFVQQSN
jgi:hypothetical protein